VEHGRLVEIGSRDFWYKIVEFLQQNWALVDAGSGSSGCTVYFLSDTSGVFDHMIFPDPASAEYELGANGFRRYSGDLRAQSMMRPPEPPFSERPHPLGSIYSSGRFWKRALRTQPVDTSVVPGQSALPGLSAIPPAERCADCRCELREGRRGRDWEH
jgi:hypothetical protein